MMIFSKFEIDFKNSIQMEKQSGRKMVMAVNYVKMEEEDILDVQFWLNKTPAERLAETARLSRIYYNGLNGSFPEKIEKVVSFRKMEVKKELLL